MKMHIKWKQQMFKYMLNILLVINKLKNMYICVKNDFIEYRIFHFKYINIIKFENISYMNDKHYLPILNISDEYFII